MAEEIQNGGTEGETPTTPASFEEWLKGQAPEIQALAEGHTTGLKSALSSEREQRKTLAKELRDAIAKVEKGSELERSLTEITGRAEAAERRAAFFETAAQPGIGCTNPRAAFLVAQAENLFKRDGSPDWAALQQVAPELFRKASSSQAHAGAGTATPPPAKSSMNDFIRRSAGRGS